MPSVLLTDHAWPDLDIERSILREVVTEVEVAEHALALVLTMARKTAFYHHETKSSRYNLQAGPPLQRIEGQTLGIVGLGNIGRRLAEKAVGLSFHVIATSRSRKNEMPGVELVDLDQLLARS